MLTPSPRGKNLLAYAAKGENWIYQPSASCWQDEFANLQQIPNRSFSRFRYTTAVSGSQFHLINQLLY